MIPTKDMEMTVGVKYLKFKLTEDLLLRTDVERRGRAWNKILIEASN